MIKKEIFREYDIRGIYPKEVNKDVVREISGALARKLFKSGKIAVAHDGRLGSSVLYKAALGKLKAQNLKLNIIEIDLATTPMFYFLVKKLKCSGGIMITASHNPKGYNGMKIVKRGAVMVGGKEVLRIMNKKS